MKSMKRLAYNLVLASGLLLAGSAQSKIITVNNEDNTNFNPGVTNLVTAIANLADGDTIQFNIPGAGVHYLLTPVNGYPIITNQNIIIDGYTQPGALANSNPIHAANNAQLKIVLSSTNGNGLAVVAKAQAAAGYAGFAHPGFNGNDYAILAVFRGTNNWFKGLAFQGMATATVGGTPGPLYGIAFMADQPDLQPWPFANAGHWHVSGCWSGLDPATGQPVYLPDGQLAAPEYAIGMQRNRAVNTALVNYAQDGTIGVAVASANPRAEFNVFLGVTAANLTGLNYRLCGNFFNVLPDGMHNFDVSYLPNANTLMAADAALIILARQGDNIQVGTDGDGVNDDQEGNVFGGASANPAHNPANTSRYIYFDAFYNPGTGTNIVFAGNYFGVAVDGVTRFTNAICVFSSFNNTGTVRFGSDFDGVSDALEANLLFNNYPFETQFPTPAGTTPETVFDGTGTENFGGMNAGVRMSFRGNVTVGNDLLPYKYANGNFSLLTPFTNYSAPFMSTAAGILPSLSVSSTTGDIIGTCASTNGGAYSNIFVDVYVLDPESWVNGALFFEQDLGLDFISTNGFPQGKTYLGTFVDNGPLDRDPGVGSFNFKAEALGLAPGTQITVTANYSADPIGTHNGRVHTSNFSDPVILQQPIKITSVTRNGSNVTITWTGGTAPFSLQKRSTIKGTWGNVQTGIATSSTTYSDSGDQAFYQVLGN